MCVQTFEGNYHYPEGEVCIFSVYVQRDLVLAVYCVCVCVCLYKACFWAVHTLNKAKPALI